jgi:hypothetical protein
MVELFELEITRHDDDVPDPVRYAFVDLVATMLESEEPAPSSTFKFALMQACEAAASTGKWLFYAELFAYRSKGIATLAFDVLLKIEDDADRLRRVHSLVGGRLGARIF